LCSSILALDGVASACSHCHGIGPSIKRPLGIPPIRLGSCGREAVATFVDRHLDIIIVGTIDLIEVPIYVSNDTYENKNGKFNLPGSHIAVTPCGEEKTLKLDGTGKSLPRLASSVVGTASCLEPSLKSLTSVFEKALAI
jgi:hypothetical protein